jgi:hypothetical protein
MTNALNRLASAGHPIFGRSVGWSRRGRASCGGPERWPGGRETTAQTLKKETMIGASDRSAARFDPI